MRNGEKRYNHGIIKTCMYECYAYGTAKEKMKDETSLSIGIPRYRRKRQNVKGLYAG